MQFLVVKNFGNVSGGLSSHHFYKAWKLNSSASLAV